MVKRSLTITLGVCVTGWAMGPTAEITEQLASVHIHPANSTPTVDLNQVITGLDSAHASGPSTPSRIRQHPTDADGIEISHAAYKRQRR